MIDVATIIFLTIATILTAGMILILFEMIIFVVVMSTYAIQDKITEIKRRHEYRFLWYYRVGLLESSWMVEPKVAKSYRWEFTPWAK